MLHFLLGSVWFHNETFQVYQNVFRWAYCGFICSIYIYATDKADREGYTIHVTRSASDNNKRHYSPCLLTGKHRWQVNRLAYYRVVLAITL